MPDHPFFVIAALAANVVLAEGLARLPGLRHLGSALIVIVTTAICANTGVLPPFSAGVPVYEGIFGYVAPLGIFWLLLQVDLRRVIRAGVPMLTLFLTGALGTALGVLAGMTAVSGEAAFGDHYAGLAAMFTGTYIGGSVNFNAMALQTGVSREGVLYAGANAVDAFMTTVWMVVTILVPKLARGREVAESTGPSDAARRAVHALREERVRVEDLAWLLVLGAGAQWASIFLEAATGLPSILGLTTLALVLAQVPAVRRLRGGGVLGMLAVSLFLSVIGALCEVDKFGELGAIGFRLLAFAGVLVLVHGLLVFGVARLLGFETEQAAVASQANIGGSTSALALARALDRPDLELPAVLVGALGLALGNYAGMHVYALLA